MTAAAPHKTNGHASGNDRGDILQRLLDVEETYWESRKDRETELKSSYASGEVTRMNPVPRGIDPLGADADYHYRTAQNYYLHVERGRAAVRNHPLVEQGINRLIANLRLDGFALDVNSGDTAVDEDIKDDWKAWTGETLAGRNMCDYEGSRSFQQIARQSFFNRCSDGDLIHLPLSDGRIQTWESHHIRTPWGRPRSAIRNNDQDGFVHGAEVRRGRTVAYWITPFNVPPRASLTKGQARRYPVFDSQGNKITFWMGFRHRFFQRRGISRLSAPADAMTGFDDLNYANIKSALRRALISYLMEDNPNAMPTNLAGVGGANLPKTGDRYAQQIGLGLESIVIEQMGEPAQVLKVPDGKKMEGWNANLPVQSFFEHAALMLTMLAVNLDLPLSFLLLDGSLVNFHGGRMTFDQVKLRLQQIQKDEIQGLWAPAYEWRTRLRLTPGSPLFDRSLATSVRTRGADPYRYTFRPRGWPYVKPAEDAAAEDRAENRNLRSLRSILADRGTDLDDHIPEVIGDRASWVRVSLETASRIAAESQSKYGIEIDVLDLARELRYGREGGSQVIGVEQIAQNNEVAAGK